MAALDIEDKRASVGVVVVERHFQIAALHDRFGHCIGARRPIDAACRIRGAGMGGVFGVVGVLAGV